MDTWTANYGSITQTFKLKNLPQPTSLSVVPKM